MAFSYSLRILTVWQLTAWADTSMEKFMRCFTFFATWTVVSGHLNETGRALS